MQYKLVDVKNVVENGVQFGTCELCMSVGTHNFEVYVVEDENGKQFEYESGYWSWGDYMTYVWESIENAIEFASWFREQPLPLDMEEDYFWSVVSRYIDEVQEAEE